MPAEQGDKNTEISDAQRLDAVMDVLKDACAKIDAGHKRMDERMDRLDARMDSVEKDRARKDSDEEKGEKEEDRKDAEEEGEEGDRKDARKDTEEDRRAAGYTEGDRKDAEGEEGEFGKARETAADKRRKDSRKDAEEEGEKKEERADAKRKDEDKEEEGERADSAPMTRAEAAALRAELASMTARMPALLTDADRVRFATIQETADPVFQAFGDRAPAPLDGETPLQYKRRLASKMQGHSPKWKDTRLSAIADEASLDVIVADVYADSLSAARRGAEVPSGQLRERVIQRGGHTIVEFDGGPESWMNPFAGNSMRGTGNWLRPH